MKKLLITGITNGKPQNLEQFFENCKYFEGKKVDITIEKHKDKRSNPQNNFWRGVVLPLSNEFSRQDGNEFAEWEWHEYFISKGYFGYKEINGEHIPKRSSEATTLEFNEAITKVQQFWALKGKIIPDPNQTEFLD